MARLPFFALPMRPDETVRLCIHWRNGIVTYSRRVTVAEAEAMLPAFNLPQIEKVEIVP